MAKYTVSMAVDGRIDVEVEAETPDEAFEAAIDAFTEVDLKGMDVVDSHPVNCYDDKGDIVKVY
jgi:hypothetical protein